MTQFVRIFAGVLFVLLAVLAPAGSVLAQDAAPIPSTGTTAIPAAYQMDGFTHIYQGWNNCGPATLTQALTYFGVSADQYPAAGWLKPNGEDKNVSPWQMAAYVNEQLDSDVRALVRQGGTLDRLKTLIANNFPVIIEAGYDPETDNQGWMGHYLLVIGYDDAQSAFTTHDTFLGPFRSYSYDHVNEFWRHFDRVYIVLYPPQREVELRTLLGTDADEHQNVVNALEMARQEAVANTDDPYAWFNMGTNFVALGMYNEAATAFDQARNVGGGLPWRMMWYQFGPFEAYYHTGRYQDMLNLAIANLNDGGGQYVEETFYYMGLAKIEMGNTSDGVRNLRDALAMNPNFTPASQALAAQGA